MGDGSMSKDKNGEMAIKKCIALLEKYDEMRRFVARVEKIPREGASGALAEIVKSAENTAAVLSLIDAAVTELGSAAAAGKYAYKFNAFKWHYIDGITYDEICERLNCGQNSPARWCREMTRLMSVKLFGADGV